MKEYHSRLSIEGAYEWIIEFVYNQMLQISIGSTGQYLLGRFDEELKALRHYDRNCSNYEVFLVAILKNIQVSLFSVYRNEYQNEVLRLEPIPSPETHSIV